jgi:hypothetical protein
MTFAERIAELGERTKRQAETVAQLKAALQAENERLMQLQRVDMPELMNELGLDFARLADGTEFRLSEGVEVKIPDERRDAAYSWLDANGFGGIIRTTVSAEFSRDERQLALGMLGTMQAAHTEASMKESIHPATLVAFIKERMAKGESFPADLFDINPYQFVKIKG